MKRIMLLVGFLIGLSACQPSSPHNYSWIDDKRNVQHLQHSVASVLREDVLSGELEGPTCAAFFVSAEILVTAYHCLDLVQTHEIEILPDLSITIDIVVNEDAIGSKVPFVDRTIYENFAKDKIGEDYFYEAIVVQTSEENDLALLQVPDEYKSKNWLRIGSFGATAGDKVYGMGMPSSQPWILTRGIVSAVKPRGRQDILHQAPISPGASGSPLINDLGHVVGVNIGYIKDSEYLSVAVPVKHLQSLLAVYSQQKK